MNKIQVLVLGAILLAILGYFCIYNRIPIIQDDIHARVEQTLNLEETQHIDINTDGRDITLSGEVENETIKQLAESRVIKVEGVRTIANKLKIVDVEPSMEKTSTSAPNSKQTLEAISIVETPDKAEGP